MGRTLSLLYGVVAYLIFFATFLYLIAFVGDLPWVPKTVDRGLGSGTPGTTALAIDLALILLFGLQHSIMARPGFKRLWTRIVPPHLERSTFVLTASLVLIFLFWQWRPLPGVVWQVEGAALSAVLWVIFAAGWGLLLLSTFLIDHFELFGLRQVWHHLRRRPLPEIRFVEPGPYRYVRHPLYLGFLMAFWATPQMTVGHLLFALGMTLYILIGVAFEERDLLAHFGDRYREYRQRVPMLLPLPRNRPAKRNGAPL